jgi:hypothetical protein
VFDAAQNPLLKLRRHSGGAESPLT